MSYGLEVENLIKEVYYKYAGAIYKYHFIHTNDSGLSEELTNDTFMVAFKKYDLFKDVINKKAWLYAVARMHIRSYYYRVKNRKIPTIPLDELTIEETVETEFLKDNLESFRGFLTSDEINMLLLKHEIGYSNDDIAKIYNITYSNCSTRLNRIKEKIEKNYFNL